MVYNFSCTVNMGSYDLHIGDATLAFTTLIYSIRVDTKSILLTTNTYIFIASHHSDRSDISFVFCQQTIAPVD